ncbi:MAG: gamma-glutamyl kinase, partial [Pseudomonadota bacterium]|nr:gamma-glutamyl kinase [Pseudomonadota bacterium]
VVTGPPELKHAPLYRYDRFFRPIYKKVCDTTLETLAVVREPVSWLGSWYRYRQRPFLDGKPNSTANVSFDEFVEAYTRGTKPAFANVGSQARFVAPRPDGAPITHLFRYEAPEKLFDFLEQRIGIRPEPRRENVSPGTELVLSDKLRDKLRRKCAEDFELYDSIP